MIQLMRGSRWEAGANRTLNIAGVEMRIEGETFRKEEREGSDSLVVVDEGWLNHEAVQVNAL